MDSELFPLLVRQITWVALSVFMAYHTTQLASKLPLSSIFKHALRGSDFFIACLSRRAVAKRGYVQTEFKLAQDAALRMPEGSIYVIPVRMDDCEVPSSLSQYQYVDLEEPDAINKIVRAMLMEWNRKRT